MNVRYETWGAWVRLDDAPERLRGALVAFDREGARKLGLDGGRWWDGLVASRPLEVHVAVTSRCAAGCTGCYQGATAHGEHVARDELLVTLDELAKHEVFTVAFGGGEPLLRDDLGELAEAARARGLVPVVTTSGLGLTAERARSLRAFAQVNVSYDGAGEDYASVRGFEGAAHAERAIALLAESGMRVGVNVVLTRETFPRLRGTITRARSCGAIEAQLLRYKPAGRAASLDYLAKRLTPEQVLAFPSVLRELHRETNEIDMAIRIDCALVCFLSSDPEIGADAERLVRAGIFGCEAGGALSAVRSDGRRAPCSFSPSDVDVDRIAAWVAHPAEPCASCTLRSVCRGGCRVVAGFDGGDRSPFPFAFAPDPECPRVHQTRDT